MNWLRLILGVIASGLAGCGTPRVQDMRPDRIQIAEIAEKHFDFPFTNPRISDLRKTFLTNGEYYCVGAHPENWRGKFLDAFNIGGETAVIYKVQTIYPDLTFWALGQSTYNRQIVLYCPSFKQMNPFFELQDLRDQKLRKAREIAEAQRAYKVNYRVQYSLPTP
jgi:hypothetical protein